MTGCQKILQIVQQLQFDIDMKKSINDEINRFSETNIDWLITQYEYHGTWII